MADGQRTCQIVKAKQTQTTQTTITTVVGGIGKGSTEGLTDREPRCAVLIMPLHIPHYRLQIHKNTI